ncbi:MAG: trypsin-like peptidase domain-containing protein [Pirellulales bacterium]
MRRTVLVAAAFLLVTRVATGLELVEVVRQMERSVVRIDTDSGLGSGVIVDDTGLILTNYHVIEGATRAQVILKSGKSLQARGFLAVDPRHDLALVMTDPFDAGAAVKVATTMPSIGEKVAAFGNPKGFSFTTSEGIVSAIRSGKELIETIGGDAYRYLGYSVDATWIQTTAPISGGNSGGPLVNMNAELVGLNTWSHTQGQNLNFAIALTDITRMLSRNSNKPVQSFATLPKARSRAVRGEPDWDNEFKLTLSTGRVFSYSVFRVDGAVIEWTSNPSRDDDVVILHPNGSLYAVAGQEKGKLSGVTLAQYENRQPMAFVTYFDGLRHGALKTWSEDGKPIIFTQYAKGKRNGFSAYHVNGKLAMVLQYKMDKLEWVQHMSGETPLEGFSSREAAEKNSTAKDVLVKLDENEKLITKNEATFRKKAREFETDRRNEIARELAPERRERSRARAAQRAAGQAAQIMELQRRASGR